MRDRTWVGEDGQHHKGTEMIAAAVGPGASRTRCCCGGPSGSRSSMAEIDRAVDGRADADDMVDEMLTLGTVQRRPTAGSSTPPATTCSADPRADRRSGGTREVRHLLRAPAAAAVGRGQRAAAHPGRARPGRAGRPARHRLRVGGRAPLPRGVQPLVARPRCSWPRPASARRNIRLGHGIIQTAPGYNHPARTAERVAMLDLVSGGRVEFGSGESSSEAELRRLRHRPGASSASSGSRASRSPSAA